MLDAEQARRARLAARLNVAAEADDVAAQVARKLGNVVVVAKGQRDVVTDGTDVLVVDEPGAPKRCGGLGDVLCGALAPLAAQAARADAADAAFVGKRPLLWACYGACVASRRAAAAASRARGDGASIHGNAMHGRRSEPPSGNQCARVSDVARWKVRRPSWFL